MGTKLRSLLGVAGLVAGAMVVALPPGRASATGPAAHVDTRTSGTKATPDAPLHYTSATNVVLNVTVTEPDESGILEIAPCSAPLGLDPIAVVFHLGETVSNLVRTGTGADPELCLRPSAPAHLIVDTWTVPTGNYVAQPTVMTIFDATATVGTADAVIPAVAGLAYPATGLSTLVTLPDGGSVILHACGAALPTAASVTGPAGVRSAALTDLGTGGTVCVHALGAAGASVKVRVELTGYYSATAPVTTDDFRYVISTGDGPLTAPGLVPVTPLRLLDTRNNAGPRRGAGQVYELDLSSKAPVDATAAVMNVTATDGAANGFVTVYPCDIARPTASNLNYVTGQTVPNLVTVALAASSKVCFYTHTAVHLVVDLSGWYVLNDGGGYRALAPTRLFDTRSSAGRTPVAAGAVYRYDLTGKVDPSADAVTMNVTVTEPAADGFLTVFPCDAPQPLASNLNYKRNQTVPNLVTVKISAARTVCFFAQQRLHLLADLAGDFQTAALTGFYALSPQRLVDTREGTEGPLLTGDVLQLTVPLPKVDAALFNVTVTDPKGDGFITVYPCGTERPTVSNLNFVVGQTVPNLVAVQLNATGQACFYAHAGTHLIVDIAGIYSADPFVDATAKLTVTSIRGGATPLP